MSVGKRLNQLRCQKFMSIEELASLMKVKAIDVSNWENDHVVPNMKQLRNLASLYSVSIDYLLDK